MYLESVRKASDSHRLRCDGRFDTVSVDDDDPSTVPTRTLRNRAARAGIDHVSCQSGISRRFSSEFGDISTFFHVTWLEIA
ncbi:hypothetical protein Y032_0112g331 [Ancylostoma ceylanicum]|uniref:Uncharacterized protein n=1 Tax=Ancylostoma ceylanicum TaxID=53326 RepID=A0A016TD47_9BILA|nr:hypothetical protein Y032_0112g331 [Ancylostoma ceylanicum]